MTNAVYYVVFFDIAKPKDHHNSRYKRVTVELWNNITDGIIEKQLEIEKYQYKLIDVTTFTIASTVNLGENFSDAFFAICNVEKIK